MHLWVTTTCVCLLLAAAPAAACPKQCLLTRIPNATAKPASPAVKPLAVKPATTLPAKPATAVKPATTLRILLEPTIATAGSTMSLPISDDIEMPWIWSVLRERVYDRLPRYERRKLSLVLSPVVVASPRDTVPGVGVAGDF